MSSSLNGNDGSSLDDVAMNGVENSSPVTNCIDNGLPATNGVVDRPSLCCKIDRVEMRGITLQQLEDLLTEVEDKCERREMTYRTSDAEKSLLVKDVTFHHIRENIIIPRTKENKKYSYIETIATSEQKTTWCVVVSLDQSFKDIVTVLKQHSKDRQLKSNDYYWMHVRVDDYIFFSLFLSVIPLIKYLF